MENKPNNNRQTPTIRKVEEKSSISIAWLIAAGVIVLSVLLAVILSLNIFTDLMDNEMFKPVLFLILLSIIFTMVIILYINLYKKNKEEKK